MRSSCCTRSSTTSTSPSPAASTSSADTPAGALKLRTTCKSGETRHMQQQPMKSAAGATRSEVDKLLPPQSALTHRQAIPLMQAGIAPIEHALPLTKCKGGSITAAGCTTQPNVSRSLLHLCIGRDAGHGQTMGCAVQPAASSRKQDTVKRVGCVARLATGMLPSLLWMCLDPPSHQPTACDAGDPPSSSCAVHGPTLDKPCPTPQGVTLPGPAVPHTS